MKAYRVARCIVCGRYSDRSRMEPIRFIRATKALIGFVHKRCQGEVNEELLNKRFIKEG